VLKHYLSLALRNARAAPFVFAMNVATLAIGLACFVTGYGLVTFWSRAEEHFANADRIAVMTMSMKLVGNSYSYDRNVRVSEPAARYLREDFAGIEKIARAVTVSGKAMISTGEHALRSYGAAVDPAFLEVFDLPFVAGDPRTALSAPRSVVLTKEHARQLFGDQDPMGRSLVIGNAVDATVTGVLDTVPEPSHLGRSTSAALPFDWLASFDVLEAVRTSTAVPNPPAQPENWFAASAITYLLLPADGSFTLGDLREQLPAFARRHLPADLSGVATISFGAKSVRDVLGDGVDSGLFIEVGDLSIPGLLLALGSLVLVVACVNYANLATARAARRTREIGLRKALGADRAQIARQYLFEGGMLTAAALLLALAVYRLMGPLLESVVHVDVTPTLFAGSRFWVFLVAVTALVTVAAGAYPAIALSRVQPVRALRASRQQVGSRGLTTVLIGVQFAVASLLLIATTVMVLQNAHLWRSGLAMVSDPLVLIENDASVTNVDSATLRAELLRLPQVRGVTAIGAPPWVNLSGGLVRRAPDPAAPAKLVLGQRIGVDFFSVFDIDLVAGRLLGPEYGDEVPGNAPAAEPSDPADVARMRSIVVDRTFLADLGFESPEAAVGQLVYSPGTKAAGEPLRIVGVVENKVFTFFDALGTTSTMYELAPRLGYQVARLSRDDVAGALDAIDGVWRGLAPNAAISRHFLDEYFEEAYTSFLQTGRVFGGLALLAFLISVTGLFGMATLIAGSRTREVGVRKAHGATTSRIVALLLTSFSKPVLVANLLVWPLGYIAARRYLDAFLAPIALTPLPFVLSLAVTLAICWLAGGSQTLRAARARPAQVLRHE